MHCSMVVNNGSLITGGAQRSTIASTTSSSALTTTTTRRRPLVTTVVIDGNSRFSNDNFQEYCSTYDEKSCCSKVGTVTTNFGSTSTSSDDGRQVKSEENLRHSSSSLLSGVIFWRTRRNKKRNVSQKSASGGAKCFSQQPAGHAGTDAAANLCTNTAVLHCADKHPSRRHNQKYKHGQMWPMTSGGNSSGTSSSGSDDETQPVKTRLDFSFEQLMKTVRNKSDETALSPDDECLTCVTRRACIQSYPCGHKVLCEKCFVTLLQVSYSEGKYPVTCVCCRSPVALFKRQESPCEVVIKRGSDPPGSHGQTPYNTHQSPLPSSSIKRPGYF